jgi:hypothetical protein
MKELRINFPDYTVEEQERDVERFKRLEKKYQPHIFLLKFDGLWASMTFSDGVKHTFYDGMNLYQTYNKVKETHPNHKMKYIINKGLENYLREQRKKELSRKSLQLNLFKER